MLLIMSESNVKHNYHIQIQGLENEDGKQSPWTVVDTPPDSCEHLPTRPNNDINKKVSICRLHVEKIDGGLMVAGVVIAANCQIILPIFGFLFLLVGIVLTAASYRGPGENEELENYEERIAGTANSRMLGPACIVVGSLMLFTGIVLCLLTKRAKQRERKIGFHCPLHGDFYPLSPIMGTKKCYALENANKTSSESAIETFLCWFKRSRRCGQKAAPVVTGKNGPPQCPHSQVSSTRSSVASSSPQSQCPTPLPFLVNSHSFGGLIPSSVAQLSPDQPFGSIKSLATSRAEVASFPLSRTPTPPLIQQQHQEHVKQELHQE